MIYRWTRLTRITHLVFSVFWMIIYLILLVLWMIEILGTRNVIMSLFFLPIIIYAMVDSYRFRLIVSDKEVIRYGIRYKRICTSDIKKIIVRSLIAVIKSYNHTIKIERNIEGRNEAISSVLRSVQGIDHVEIVGDKELIKELLGNEDSEICNPG